MQIGIETASLIVTIALAFIGYIVTYLNNLAISRRNERLQLITSQLNELYGPMYVITQTGDALFRALGVRAKAQRASHFRHLMVDHDTPEGTDEISEWRIWVENVFMPLNDQLEQIIIQKAHLIREEEMPECLKVFSAHYAGYKALIKKWEGGDLSESTSIIPYPIEIKEYAQRSYRELKKEQLRRRPEITS